jgi:hypothetical protein
VPRLCEFYPGICLTTEEKARKLLSQVADETYDQNTYTLQHKTKCFRFEQYLYSSLLVKIFLSAILRYTVTPATVSVLMLHDHENEPRHQAKGAFWTDSTKSCCTGREREGRLTGPGSHVAIQRRQPASCSAVPTAVKFLIVHRRKFIR